MSGKGLPTAQLVEPLGEAGQVPKIKIGFSFSIAILNSMDWLRNNWFVLFAITLLLGSFGDHPYGYYQLLRWVVAIVAFYSAYTASQEGHSSWMWILIALGILFNPIRPFYLERETWVILDVISAVVLTIFLVSKRKLYEGKI